MVRVTTAVLLMSCLFVACGAAPHRRSTPARKTSLAAPATAAPPTTSAPTTALPPTDAPTTTRPTAPATTAGTATSAATAASQSLPPSSEGGPGTFRPTVAGPLTGKVIAVDPGHNGANYTDPSYINSIIFNGREQEACDTTGTETDGGYTESEFNFDVAEDLTSDLLAEGATVVLTRTTNTGVGPCVTERAAIGNQAHADAAVSIHADGGPPDGYGFAILEPVADGINDAIVAPSQQLGADLRAAFAAGTGEAESTYDGADGVQARDDLGGLNLSTVPKVFIECANMRNAADAGRLTSDAWQAEAARAIAAGLTTFLTGR